MKTNNFLFYSEFIGVPGAGKTTICNLVIKSFDLDKHKIFPMIGNIKNGCSLKAIFFLFKNLFFIFSLVQFMLTSGRLNKSSITFALKLILRVYGQTRRFKSASKENYDIYILDQGILQGIWSLVISRPKYNVTAINLLVKSLSGYIPDYIFFCKTDIEVAMKRILNRESMGSRFDKMNLHDGIAILTKNHFHLENIVEYCKNKLNKKVYVFHTDQPKKKISDDIYKLIIEKINQNEQSS